MHPANSGRIRMHCNLICCLVFIDLRIQLFVNVLTKNEKCTLPTQAYKIANTFSFSNLAWLITTLVLYVAITDCLQYTNIIYVHFSQSTLNACKTYDH